MIVYNVMYKNRVIAALIDRMDAEDSPENAQNGDIQEKLCNIDLWTEYFISGYILTTVNG